MRDRTVLKLESYHYSVDGNGLPDGDRDSTMICCEQADKDDSSVAQVSGQRLSTRLFTPNLLAAGLRAFISRWCLCYDS